MPERLRYELEESPAALRSIRRRDWGWMVFVCVLLFELSFFFAVHALQAAGFYRWLYAR